MCEETAPREEAKQSASSSPKALMQTQTDEAEVTKLRTRLRKNSSSTDGITRSGSLAAKKTKRQEKERKRQEVQKELQAMLMQLPGRIDVEVRPSH